tara:strand:- start:403 stop:582 length:180 start_codon:yes stop_codon:yes gene_type:complete
MINLKEHKVFVEELNMEMVPLKVAEEAVEKAQIKQLDEAIKKLSIELTSLKPDMTEFND